MNFFKEFSNKKILSLIWHQDGTPYFKAKGAAAGVFSGCFPFFGLQTLMGVFLAKIFKGNSILAAFGTWISNPFTYVPLYFLNYKLGSFILNKDRNIVDISHIATEELWSQGWYLSSRLIMGSIMMGLFSGLLGGIVLYFFLKKLSKLN